MTVGSRSISRREDDCVAGWLGGSEMAERIRTFDWSATSLGPIANWSSSLRSAVVICLHSGFQMAIYWGPELNCIYNDAEREVLGELHPRALGMPAEELLRDSWTLVGPQLRAVMEQGESTWAQDQPVTFDRRGRRETGYFTYSSSPILDDQGGIGGVLLITQETTARILAERRTEALEGLERAKTTLFSNASHQLRTPLTLVLGPLSEVLDEGDVPSLAKEQIALARRNASWMLKIVNGLLDFTRIEAGERIGVPKRTDLAQLTSEVAAMFRSTVESAGLRLAVDCPTLPRLVDLDREAWERVVSNLLSNALKFTAAGSIHVQVRDEHERAVLTVKDTGIGIAPEDLGQIFGRFYRVQDPRARSHEGTGLGLALVRELVRMHDGSIAVESTPGEGTTFVVRVPYRGRDGLVNGGHENGAGPRVGAGHANGSGPRVGATTDAFVEEARAWLEPGNGSLAAAPVEPGQNDAVLVVEDNHDMRDYLCRSLAPRYAVRLAMNGADAYRSAIEDPPSVVISDVMMPGADGFRLLHDLRSDRRTKNIPVILVSARADPESTVAALQRGADDYLVKPFGARELLARTRAVVDGSRRRTEDAEARGRAAERARAEGQLRALLNDLKAAQRRIAAAGDAERRRIEHNLHDGAQQRLMAIRLELGLLRGRLELDPGSAASELDGLRSELDAALEELRELAHGLYPSVLASEGLGPALDAAARHAAIPTDLEADDFPRLPRAIENTVYFCCLEALQNAAKYAGDDARATVRLGLRHGVVEFEVSDDGAGFDRSAVASGYGLTNLTDRLGALGGEARITSAPGQGTTVAGQIPLVWDVPA